MRNLNAELKEFGLDWEQRESVLQWLNTITNKDLSDNGSKHAFFPGDQEPELPEGYKSWDDYYSQESQIKRWLEDNIENFRQMESGKLLMVKDMKKRFQIHLGVCLNHINEVWEK